METRREKMRKKMISFMNRGKEEKGVGECEKLSSPVKHGDHLTLNTI